MNDKIKSARYAGLGCVRTGKNEVTCPPTGARPKGLPGEKAVIAYGSDDIFESERKNGSTKGAADELRSQGLTVIVKEKASKKEMVEALNSKKTAAVIISSHGRNDGSIRAHGGRLHPDDVKGGKTKTLVDLQTCHSAEAGAQEKWKAKFPKARVITTNGAITNEETRDHLTPDTPNDKLRKQLTGPNRAGPELRSIIDDVSSKRAIPGFPLKG